MDLQLIEGLADCGRPAETFAVLFQQPDRALLAVCDMSVATRTRTRVRAFIPRTRALGTWASAARPHNVAAIARAHDFQFEVTEIRGVEGLGSTQAP